jgi:TonB-dependent receptor
MNLKSLFAIALFTLVANLSFSQNSSIKGKVVDKKTGELLIGVVIKIQGIQKGVSSNIDGEYMFPIAPGMYTVNVLKYDIYDPQTITGVVVKAGTPTKLDFILSNDGDSLTTVTIKYIRNQGTTASLINDQQTSGVVQNGMSSDDMKKTPDTRTSDVLKRISGASIQDNKFVVIRGLNDRYNAAYINGAPLPSSESDRKAFSFDIFPSNMLDNLIISKTATPDLPAEFAGGIIQVNTKNIPNDDFMNVTMGAGYNTITTGQNQLYYKGGKTDWLGIDDGSRAMPGVIPSQANFPINIHEQAKLAQQTNVDWKLYNKKFTPNYNFQYSLGHTFRLKNKKARKDSLTIGNPLGVVFALTYNRTNNYNEIIRRSYSGGAGPVASQIDFDYLDKVYSAQVLAGALANFSYILKENHTFSFKNLYSINSDDRVINRSGTTNPLEVNPTLLLSNARWFTGNKIYSGQLSGDHFMPKLKLRANWTGSFSQIERVIPSLRRSIYTRFAHLNDPTDPVATDTIYTASISNTNVGPDYGGGMFWSENHEKIYSFKGDIKYTLKFGKKKSENENGAQVSGIEEKKKKNRFETDIKLGGFYQQRSRNFFARQLGYTKYGVVGGNVNFKDSLLYMNDNDIFSNGNMGLISPNGGPGGNGIGGFKLTDGTKPSDRYTASSTLGAAYLMFDSRYSFARLIWGARLENYNQKLNAKYSINDTVKLNFTKLDILPSANLIIALTKKQNLRLCYSQTVNRPEFRELAPFAFYDFNTQFVISGDTNLRRAKIYNEDIRYEFYPGLGQVFSVGGFFKQFVDPIEQISRPDVTGEVSFRNVSRATNYGTELEFRVLLGQLFRKDTTENAGSTKSDSLAKPNAAKKIIKFLDKLTLFSNLAIIRSKVNVSDIIGTAYASRPLQGQSPYVLNAGLQYVDTAFGMTFSVSYNKVGNRIAIVGNVNEPDIWEAGRTFLDFQLTKSFLKKKRLEIKLNAQNVLAQNQNFYQNRNLVANDQSGFKSFMNGLLTGDKSNQNAYNKAEDDLLWSTKFGKVYSITISYKF